VVVRRSGVRAAQAVCCGSGSPVRHGLPGEPPGPWVAALASPDVMTSLTGRGVGWPGVGVWRAIALWTDTAETPTSAPNCRKVRDADSLTRASADALADAVSDARFGVRSPGPLPDTILVAWVRTCARARSSRSVTASSTATRNAAAAASMTVHRLATTAGRASGEGSAGGCFHWSGVVCVFTLD